MKRILMYIITTIALLTIGCSDFDTSGNDINPLSGQTAAPEDITSFTFSASTSTVIDESTGIITVTVPFGTSVTALVATFTTGGGTVKIGSTDQVSGTTANDFTSSKTYTVTGPDGTPKVYTVTVTVALASSKAITAFSFTSPAATGVITGTNIAVTVPFGTNVTALAATFSTDGGSVKVGSTVQTSGTTTNNFTSPVTYIVTAANGSTQNYIVTVTLASAQAVTFSTLTANGSSGTVTTTTLTLTFSVDPTTLAAGDITVTGATKGALTGTGTTRSLAISAITVADGATVSVTVASPSGFVITGSPKTVAVYVNTGPVAVTFVSATQTGGASLTANSTGLTLTFSVDPTTLAAGDITVTGATKGALTGTGTTRSLAISAITVANGATVSVAITSPSGYTVSGSPQTAVVYRVVYIGMPYQGRKVAYILNSSDLGYNASVPHGLIVSNANLSEGIQWAVDAFKNTLITPDTGIGIGTGSANTNKIIAQNGAGTTYAAGLARAYTGGGYSDWYLPSKDELYEIYWNGLTIGGIDMYLVYDSSSQSASSSRHALSFPTGFFQNESKWLSGGAVRVVRSF